jgi:hypothetical protein
MNNPAADRTTVDAFAADLDDGVSLQSSQLPKRPLSVLAIDTPQSPSATEDLMSAVDGLAQLEGGGSPLYAALDAMLDVMAATPELPRRRALVVVTHGRDAYCAAEKRCMSALDAVIRKSRAADVPIVTLGLADRAGFDSSLARLAEATGGTAMWADNLHQLGTAFGALNGVLDGSADVSEAHFRMESSMGAFKSGATVMGALRFKVCPWDCYSMTVPIALRIQ